jgi:hypothetical protein
MKRSRKRYRDIINLDPRCRITSFYRRHEGKGRERKPIQRRLRILDAIPKRRDKCSFVRVFDCDARRADLGRNHGISNRGRFTCRQVTCLPLAMKGLRRGRWRLPWPFLIAFGNRAFEAGQLEVGPSSDHLTDPDPSQPDNPTLWPGPFPGVVPLDDSSGGRERRRVAAGWSRKEKKGETARVARRPYEWGYDVSSFGDSQRRHGTTQGESQSPLGHPAERVGSRWSRSIRAYALARSRIP